MSIERQENPPEDDFKEETGKEIDYSKPFRVIVLEDCREEKEKQISGSLDLQKGWCLGLYEFPEITKKAPEWATGGWVTLNPELGDDSEVIIYSPLIYTDNCHFIWGIESYWGKDDEIFDEILQVLTQQSLKNAVKLTNGDVLYTNLNQN